MKTKKSSQNQEKQEAIKKHLFTKFTQVLKGLGFSTQMFERKLEKMTKKLAKSITKKKSKEEIKTKTSQKQVLIKPANLKKLSAKPNVNSTRTVKTVSQPTITKDDAHQDTKTKTKPSNTRKKSVSKPVTK
jgi:hypothetical protein